MKKFVIQNVESDLFLQDLFISNEEPFRFVSWTPLLEEAASFENEEEAEAVIGFVGAVINWELEELLIVVSE